MLVFSTSETECAGESWQELRDDLSYVRQVATRNFVEGIWFLSPTSAGPELLLCMLMEMAFVPEGADRGLDGAICGQTHGPIPAINLDLFRYGFFIRFGWPIRSRAEHTGPVCLLLAQLLWSVTEG